MNNNNAPRIISLVGPKHSGKSSVGKELARLFNADFLDLDSSIEEKTGKSPRSLYKEGAEVFRKAEFETLREIFDSCSRTIPTIVLATGGGVVDNIDAVVQLQQNTLIINLEVSAKTAWKRIVETSRHSGELPPFLQTENPEETHRELHERRSAAYKKLAAYSVNAEETNIEMIAQEIKNLISMNC
jgi:shikimate kinase